MKAIIVIVLASFVYGLARLALSLIKELAEMASEAWRSGETSR